MHQWTTEIGISGQPPLDVIPGPVEITPVTGEVPLNVVINSPATQNVIYTLDGTAPSFSNGIQVPLPVTLNLLEPCTLRAVATNGTHISVERSGVYVYTGRVGDPTWVGIGGGLICWYRSDSVTVGSGTLTWNDQGGRGINATFPLPTPEGDGVVAISAPTVVPNVLEGFPALRFDGVGSMLMTEYQNFTQPDLIFVVAKQTSKATPARFVEAWGDSNERIYLDTNGHYHIEATEVPPNPNLPFDLSDSIDHSGAFHNFESLWNGTSSAGWVDGTQVFTGNTYEWSYAVISIGREIFDGTYLTGDIVEIIRYWAIPGSSPLLPITESDRKWVEDYLSNRYNLPNRRPFAPGPMNIAGLVAWLKADALTLADGAEIAAWVDSSGNGHTATKGTAGPIFKTNILNGHPVARFSASNDWLVFANPTTNTGSVPYTIIFVSKGGGGYIFGEHGGGPFMYITNRPAPEGFVISCNIPLASGGDYTGAFHVFIAEVNGPTSKGYIDGSLVSSGDAGGSQINALAIGAYNSSGTDASLFSGDIAEIVIFRRILTAHERQEIEAYLKIKYAIP